MEVIKLNILDICFEIQFSPDSSLPLNTILKPFIQPADHSIYPPTYIDFEDNSFDGMSCTQHLDRDYHSLTLEQRGSDDFLFHYLTGQMRANRDFTEIKLWLPLERQMSLEHDGFANYNGDPSLRLVVWARASRNGYCYMHGALVVLDGKYILLVGSSGTGKTTLSGLACDCGATRLTEEDPFIACPDEEPVAYGTPWPGMRGPSVSRSGKLHAIFYLSHADENDIRLLGIKKSCHNLLKHSRTFNWLPDTLPPTIELFNKVALAVPSYDFGFVPDNSAIAAIRKVL